MSAMSPVQSVRDVTGPYHQLPHPSPSKTTVSLAAVYWQTYANKQVNKSAHVPTSKQRPLKMARFCSKTGTQRPENALKGLFSSQFWRLFGMFE
jgi:hypothetical protein